MSDYQLGMFSVSPYLSSNMLIPNQNLGWRLPSFFFFFYWKWLHYYGVITVLRFHQDLTPVLTHGAHPSTCVLWVFVVPVSRATGWLPAPPPHILLFPQAWGSDHSPALLQLLSPLSLPAGSLSHLQSREMTKFVSLLQPPSLSVESCLQPAVLCLSLPNGIMA